MKKFMYKSLYFIASLTETLLSSNAQDKTVNEEEKFSDGIGLYNVSGKVMAKHEVEAEKFETGLYDDY